MFQEITAYINNLFMDMISNPYGMLLTIFIILLIIFLFIAIFSKKTKRFLVKCKILEKEESPQKLLIIIIVILIIVKGIQGFVIQPFLVDGGSMLPTLKSGELLIVDKLTFDINNLKRGDIIVFRHVKNDKFNGKFFIKRLIALPNDRVVVFRGITTIYNKENPEGIILDESFVKYKDTYKNIDITLNDGEYLAFGDNRAESYDSRSWGVIYKKDISGKVVYRLYPFDEMESDPGTINFNFLNK